MSAGRGIVGLTDAKAVCYARSGKAGRGQGEGIAAPPRLERTDDCPHPPAPIPAPRGYRCRRCACFIEPELPPPDPHGSTGERIASAPRTR